MKKILIFYASYGGGHLSAARSIKEYLEANYNDLEIHLVDCMKYVSKPIEKITTTAYNEMAKKMPWAWGRIYQKSQKGPMAKISNASNELLAIMTDYAPHDQWLVNSDFVDYFFVAHDGMKIFLAEKGILSNKIFATGIPLSNRFLKHYNKKEILDELGLKENKKTVLFFAGGEFGLGKSKTYDMLKTFAENFDNIQVVAISGRNEKMKRNFEYLVTHTHKEDSIKVLDYTTKIPEIMSISDLVVTKPGGLTTSESLASGLPIIVINPIPGQEEENAEFLESKKVAIWIQKNDNAKEILQDLFSSPEKMQEMKINARLLAKKNSCKDICEILLNRHLTN